MVAGIKYSRVKSGVIRKMKNSAVDKDRDGRVVRSD